MFVRKPRCCYRFLLAPCYFNEHVILELWKTCCILQLPHALLRHIPLRERGLWIVHGDDASTFLSLHVILLTLYTLLSPWHPCCHLVVVCPGGLPYPAYCPLVGQRQKQKRPWQCKHYSAITKTFVLSQIPNIVLYAYDEDNLALSQAPPLHIYICFLSFKLPDYQDFSALRL